MKKIIYGISILTIGVVLGYQAKENSALRPLLAKIGHLKVERPSAQAMENTKKNISTSDDGMNKSVAPAREMLQSKFGTVTPFPDRSAMEIGKILNYIVFNHCSSAIPHTGQKDINELFEVCRTACGGYAYVLRGLLAAHGIKTRYANLYNLPQQGNHTMVEAEVGPGKWALFDPTFGAFFSSTGAIDGTPLSLEEIRFNLSPVSLSKHVFTAKKRDIALDNIDDLYSKSIFDYPYMKVENYLNAEISAPVGLNLTAPLTLTLNIANGKSVAGNLNAKTIQEGQAAFLAWTNGTLNNKDPSDDTSYLFHVAGDFSPYFKTMNIVNINGLKVGANYDLAISGIAEKEVEMQIVDIGRNIMLNTILPEKINSNSTYILQRKFRAASENAQLAVINVHEHTKAYIFGASVIETRNH
jgi:hypothetical protein